MDGCGGNDKGCRLHALTGEEEAGAWAAAANTRVAGLAPTPGEEEEESLAALPLPASCPWRMSSHRDTGWKSLVMLELGGGGGDREALRLCHHRPRPDRQA